VKLGPDLLAGLPDHTQRERSRLGHTGAYSDRHTGRPTLQGADRFRTWTGACRRGPRRWAAAADVLDRSQGHRSGRRRQDRAADHRHHRHPGRQGHRSPDRRGGVEHRRVPPARKQYGGLSARYRVHVAGTRILAAPARSIVAARLRRAARRHQGKGCGRRALFRKATQAPPRRQ
jgi:hypothetical protein